MRIIIDCYGGDYCPKEAVAGAIAALNKLPELSVILTGYSDELNALLQEYKYDKGRLEVAAASEVITNSDSPAKAVMRKKDSSTVVGLKLLNEGRADKYQIIWYADRCYDFITKGKIISSLYDRESIRES